MEKLGAFEQDAFSIGVVVAMVLLAAVFLWTRRRSLRDSGRTSKTKDRFNTLALKAGGRVVAERLVAGALRNGAKSRTEAIERAIHDLDRDRRSWR